MNSERVMRLTWEHVKLCHARWWMQGRFASAEHLTDEEFRPAAESLLQGHLGKPVWLFAYGSLIWKPEVPHEDMKRATAKGWHRAFSMQIRRYRATEDQPGYMMCLDRGGSCEGVVLRLPEAGILDVVEKLVRRELSRRTAIEGVRWIDVETEDGPLQALAFYELHRESSTTIPPGVPRRSGGWPGAGLRALGFRGGISLQHHCSPGTTRHPR